MKKLSNPAYWYLLILVLITGGCLFGCKKATDTPQRLLLIETDTMHVSYDQSARGGVKGKPKPDQPPTDNPPPPPPPTGSGYSCIYIDTDGEQTSSYFGSFYAEPSGLTPEQVAQVLSEVQALYAAFNVIVTNDINVYQGANQYKRTRVIVTPTDDWYPAGSTGVAYTGSFTWGDNTPCFVFSDRLYYIAHYVAEIVAHEAGHTIGLRHQSVYDENCVRIAAYRAGAVMGNSLNSPQGQWMYGTTTSCTTYQDDKLMLASVLTLR